MRTLILLLSLLSSTLLPAQEGETVSIANGGRPQQTDAAWTLKLGTRLLLRSNAEDPARNVVTIKRSALKKKGDLVLTYTPGAAQPGWERTFTVTADADGDLGAWKKNPVRPFAQAGAAGVKLSTQSLALLAKTRKELHIYTIALPTDPDLRARIRVRRVHLATIKFL